MAADTAPFWRDPEALARLTTPRPDADEADSEDPCAWCLIPLGDGEAHVRPVGHEGFAYGSPACAAAAVESGGHAELVHRRAQLARQAARAPRFVLRTGAAR